MEGQAKCGSGMEKPRKAEPEVTTDVSDNAPPPVEVNNSQECSVRDTDIQLCGCRVNPPKMTNDCRSIEMEGGLYNSKVGQKVEFAKHSNEDITSKDVQKQLEKDDANVSTASACSDSSMKGCLCHCRTNLIETSPLPCGEAEKAGDLIGCKTSNASVHPVDKRIHGAHSVLDLPEYTPGQPSGGGAFCLAESEDQDDHPCEYSPQESYEQLPNFARLEISSTMDYVAHYPYEDCSPSEFVMMSDFVAVEETQLSLSCGDRVLLLSAVTSDWWWVNHNGNCGYVPASHLHRISDEDDTGDDDPWQDEEYYGSYKTLRLHLEMLSDQPRTHTYRDVILQNSSALKGKRILDLGCGTGIISFFCAQLAQPDVVYAVEASDIAEQTSKLVEENGFSGTVKVIRQRAEQLQLPSKVDVLVSEWMGTCLVFEFMLESVLLARDLWLEEGGIMWPSTASIHIVPCMAEKEYASKVLFWDSPYGLNFKMLKPMAVQEFLSKPKPDYVLSPEDCLSEPCVLLDVDMKTLKIEELERLGGSFIFHVKRDGVFHGFTTWFSVHFQNIDCQGHVELNTGPFNPLTHWKHTLFLLDEPLQVHRGDKIEGSAVFQRNSFWRRHLSVTLNWSVTGESATTAHNVGCKVFPIWR